MTRFADASRRAQIVRLRRLARAALTDWGRGDAPLALLRHGHNTVFRAGDAVVRVCRPGWNTDAAIRSELEFLRHLASVGLPVPEPFADPVTAAAPGVSEERTCVLLRYQPGRLLRRATPTGMRRLGTLLRRLHDATQTFTPSSGFERPVWDADGLLRGFPGDENALERLTPVQRRTVARAEVRVRERLAALPRTPATYGVIHADLHLGNAVVCRDRLAPIDFDDCGFGWFAYDLAVAVVSVERWPHDDALRDALLASYGSTDPDAVDALSEARRLALARWMAGLLGDAAYGERMRPHIDRLVERL